jgi:hypothetical protein
MLGLPENFNISNFRANLSVNLFIGVGRDRAYPALAFRLIRARPWGFEEGRCWYRRH